MYTTINSREPSDDSNLDETLDAYFDAALTASKVALKEEQESAFYDKLCVSYHPTTRQESAEKRDAP